MEGESTAAEGESTGTGAGSDKAPSSVHKVRGALCSPALSGARARELAGEVLRGAAEVAGAAAAAGDAGEAVEAELVLRAVGRETPPVTLFATFMLHFAEVEYLHTKVRTRVVVASLLLLLLPFTSSYADNPQTSSPAALIPPSVTVRTRRMLPLRRRWTRPSFAPTPPPSPPPPPGSPPAEARGSPSRRAR
eukprot:4188229-Pyramimonas_sp.AAC.1